MELPHLNDLEVQKEIMDVANGYWKSRALQYVIENNVAHHLVNGPKSSFTIAKEIGVNPDFLYRTMRALSCLGIFKEEEDYGVFSQNRKSYFLTQDGVNGFAHISNSIYYQAWGSLGESIKHGEARGLQSIGYDGLWDIDKRNPEFHEIFMNAMSNFTNQLMPYLLKETDFSCFDIVCDLGGSHGLFVLNILKQFPTVKKGINFDLPLVISQNKQLLTESRESEFENNVLSRFQEEPGNFFQQVPEADCFIMKMIFHDWKDKESIQILKSISKKMKPTSRIMIFDSVINVKNEPNYHVWLDLHMMHIANGRERSTSEWENIVEKAGLKIESLSIFSEKYTRTNGRIVLRTI
ncbi:hypothetical protein CYY_001155 [Polysphondylium violaceum]|uniref:O-methyltransferase domain-containing protein n=1 Tax=Polysphondylium violaceum TaxID=133409 RepID=A0A8J4V875_9MYCE|nr:hypothetical protein CYY_001155 [Polysphondylium violaceum]